MIVIPILRIYREEVSRVQPDHSIALVFYLMLDVRYTCLSLCKGLVKPKSAFISLLLFVVTKSNQKRLDKKNSDYHL